MILTNYFLKRKLKTLIAQLTKRKRVFYSLKEAHRILVIYDSKERDALEPCVETLRMLRKKVTTCLFVSSGSPQSKEEGYLYVNGQKDIDIWGFPTQAKCKEINSCQADILIYMGLDNNYTLQYLMLQHPCLFKVGARQDGPEIFDLSILVTKKADLRFLFGQILFYLQTIRAK